MVTASLVACALASRSTTGTDFNVTQFWSTENFADLPFNLYVNSETGDQGGDTPEPSASLPLAVVLSGFVIYFRHRRTRQPGRP